MIEKLLTKIASYTHLDTETLKVVLYYLILIVLVTALFVGIQTH